MSAKNKIISLLKTVDIEINGNRPWDIKVNNEKLYNRVLAQGALGFGESYMDGWWDCEQIDEMIKRILKANLQRQVIGLAMIWQIIKSKLINRQNIVRAKVVGKKHYDLGNDLYKAMLDRNMNYSCAYWKDVDNLDDAQLAKLELCCKKLNLKPGMTVLDIGCGWGAFAKYAAEKYDVKVTGVTISEEQAKLAQEKCQGLPVEIKLLDYRKIEGQFDAIISIGMFEHVGYKNYREYMKTASHLLKPNGLFLLHTIGHNISVYSTNPWIDKYIFPNSMIPSAKQITKAAERIFFFEDWHNFGAYYDLTLMAWYKNFINAWPQLKSNYDERFFRMWKFYLLSCAGDFRARKLQLWQIIFTKNGIEGGYKSIR